MRNPLEPPPPRSEALEGFSRYFRIDRRAPPERLLVELIRAFSHIPYENLTKIIKYDAYGDPNRARRFPLEVISDHVAMGAGGTCFSLTATLIHLLRAAGFEAEPILADRPYGENTHCALLVRGDGGYCLVDPGYLILRPIPLETLVNPLKARESAGEGEEGQRKETRVLTDFNEIIFVPTDSGRRLELHTVQDGKRVHRITFKLQPADPGEFLAAWDSSFEWDMMRAPVLTRVAGSKQIYLHETRFQVRESSGVSRSKLTLDALPETVEQAFGLAPSIVRRALEVLARKRESCIAQNPSR